MHAYWCQLVHSVTLIAQPRSKTPFAKVGAMKSGKYEPKNSGTFGVMWFTDFGDKFWEACRGVDDTPKLRLRDSGFDAKKAGHNHATQSSISLMSVAALTGDKEAFLTGIDQWLSLIHI